MGTDCFCKRAKINEEQKTQVDYYEHKNEEILSKLKINLNEDAYTNINYISKEDFYKLVKLFPDSEELISEFKQKLEVETTKNSNQSSERESIEPNIKDILNPIKFYDEKAPEQYFIYYFNINNKYEFCGKGYQMTNIFLYYGNIENNKYNGKGILIKNDGSSISGDWIDGICTGKAKLIIKNILEYEGDYKNNKKEGFGTEIYKDGSRYEGEFKENKKNGKGKCFLNNGEIYEGEFKDDLYEGEGIYKWPSEPREYKGHFEKGNINGKGINKYKDGSIFEGYYKNGLKHGEGIYKWKNGKICKGNWLNNKLHGNCFFEINEEKFNITFRFGKIISVTEFNDEKEIRFDIQNIINKEKIENLDKYLCSECQKLIYHPHKCINCGKNYCLECIKEEKEIFKKCKFCEQKEYETDADLVLELINNIKIFCYFCKKELDYKSALNHIHK